MWFVGSPCAAVRLDDGNWTCVFRGFVAAIEDYCSSFLYSKFRFKRKRKIKKECSCLCLSCQHINRPEFYYTALLTTTSVPCILFGVLDLDFSLFDLKKQNFCLNLHAFSPSPTCDHDSPSIWSPIVVPKQPRPVKLLPTQQDRAH